MPESAIVRFVEQELRLDLYPGQRDLLAEFDLGGYSEGIWRCGRQGGKSTLSDCLALYDCLVREFPGRRGLRSSVIVSPTLEQSRDHILRIRDLIDGGTEEVRSQVENATADEISFVSGTRIRARPASGRALRGVTASSVVLDEFAFVLESEKGNTSSEAILAAAGPAMSTFGRRGWLLAISTPLWATGGFHRLEEEARSGRFAHMQFVHAPTWDLNPTVPDETYAIAKLRDPERFQREYAAEYVEGAYGFLTIADINSCTRPEKASAPRQGVTYKASIDPGYQADAFALSIGHKADEVAHVDGCWTWEKAGHETTLDAIAEICRAYHVRQVVTDQGGGVRPVLEGLQRRGFAVRFEPWTNESKLRAFTALKVGLNTRTISLPNDGPLLAELTYLEARPTPGGSVRIAASGHRHDDRATATASLIDSLVGRHVARPEDVVGATSLLRSLNEPTSGGLSSLNGVLGDVGGGFPF